ncbi:MAG: hypothetical protein ACR2PI_10345 [Hyphomicrobiaceae bacterium]
MSKTIWITSGVVAAAIGLTALVAHAERGRHEGRGYGGHHGGYGHHGRWGRDRHWGEHGRRGRRGRRGRDITKDDFDARTRARFAKWDANSDGVVDAGEAEARIAARMERRFARRGGRRLQRMLRRLDADRDGKITQQELEARVTERFERMDLTGDGRITDADLPPMLRGRDFLSRETGVRRHRWRRARHHGRRGHRRGRRMLRHLAGADTNKDGAVTIQELQDRATKRFERWDWNKDGVLDKADRDTLRKETMDYRVRRFMHRLGAGKDGKLTMEQFAKHRDARFAKMDADGSGVIERSERRGRGGHHRGRRWHRGYDDDRGGRPGRGRGPRDSQ